jgi:hypothetical protein
MQQVATTSGPRLRGWRLLGLGLAVVLLIQSLFVVSYVGALHNPKPQSLPFGVTGSPVLAAAIAKQLSLRTKLYADESAARRAIDRRTIYGALITGSSGAKLLVAPAAGNAVAALLTSAFTQAAAATGQKLAVVQVHELPGGDRVGVASFLVAMALVVGGYLSATIATTLGGAVTGPRRAAALAFVAAAGALITYLLAGPVLGAIPGGHFFELVGIFAFLMLAVALASAGLQTLFGPFGTLIVIVAFVIFGAPAAGGSLPRPFLPEFWATIGPFLPPGAGTTAIRNTIYFDANGIGQPLLVLAAYFIAGGVVVLGVRRRSRPPVDAAADIEAASGATAVVV